MRCNQRQVQQIGLTLIELMVTMSIAVILLTIGVPSFVDMVNANKSSSYVNDLITDLNYARNEAITRGFNVVVCKGPTATNCTTGNWEDGWKVFEDCNGDFVLNSNGANSNCPDRDGDGNADAETLLRVHAALPSGWTIKGNAGNQMKNKIAFSPTGRTSNGILVTNGPLNGTLSICKDGVVDSHSKAVIVSRTGRARTAVDTDSDGIPNMDTGAGSNITCQP
jgi:type IV fimbrial biogenesis protein FimT